MLFSLLFMLFIMSSLINIVHMGAYLIAANMYDVASYRRLRRIPKGKFKPVKRKVTVLIPAHNEQASIVRSIKSVLASSYRNIEIIVIDDASTDNTRAIVRSFIKKNRRKNIKLMYKRTNSGKAAALNHALRTARLGDFVMTLDADSQIRPNTIENTVKYFADMNVAGVAANVVVTNTDSILGLVQKFEYMIAYRSKKFFSMTNSEFIVGGVASTYRTEVIRRVGFYDDDVLTEDIDLSLKVVSLGNKYHRLVYGADVVAYTEGVTKFGSLIRQRYRWKMGSLQTLLKHRELFASNESKYTKMLTYYRIPMAFLGEFLVLIEPLMIAFILYICFASFNSALIVGSYMTITLYVLLNVLPDENMTRGEKLQMAAYSPIIYFLFYIMNIVQLSAIVRCLRNYRQVQRKVSTGSTWVSPERVGAADI